MVWAFYALPWEGIELQPNWERVVWLPWRSLKARDVLLNLVYFFPLGVLAIARHWSTGRAIMFAAALSVGTETLQVFAVTRWPSVSDVVFNCAGAACGVILQHVLGHRTSPASDQRRLIR